MWRRTEMSRAGNGNGAYTERHKLFCQMKLKTKPLECPHDEISWAGLLKMKNAKRSVNNKRAVVSPSHFDTKMCID